MKRPEAIAIGSSAGAVDALLHILPLLPPDFSLPVFIVVHLIPDKESIMADIFQHRCQLNVKEAEDKETIVPGTIYFAPPDYHLLVEKDETLSLSSEEPVLHSRPSIDVLFETAADAYHESLIGIILTGASSDGARGLKAVCAAGGKAIVQDPATAYTAVMPAAALEVCPAAEKMTLDEITRYLTAVHLTMREG